MNINQIRETALAFKPQNKHELSRKIKELKDNGIPFWGCVAFLQHNQKVFLSEARKQTLELDVWGQKEKDSINESDLVMMSDFHNNENED